MINTAKLSNEMLRKYCREIGVGTGGKKSDLIQRLTTGVAAAKELASRSESHIIAIDVGYVNLAYVHLIRNDAKPNSYPNVVKWDLINPHMQQTYDVFQYAVKAKAMLDLICTHDSNAVYLVEKQQLRITPFRPIPTAILRNVAFEAMLVGQLVERFQNANIKSMLPASVALHFNLDQGYKDKKISSTNLVTSWINTDLVYFDGELKAMFLNSKKKDDLADCLLMAVAHLQWRDKACSLDFIPK